MRTLDQAIQALAATRTRHIAEFRGQAPEPSTDKSSPAQREVVGGRVALVLGGHRTGTSATTGLLALLGLHGGDNLQTGDAHNQKGYFEDRAVVALHDRLLHKLQTSWDNPRPLPEGWTTSAQADVASQEIESAIAELAHSGNGRVGVVKDPRTCLTLPLWLAACKKRSVTPLFVIPIRAPDASITSLVKRNGFSTEHAAILWLTHLRNAELFSRGQRRVFVHYESVLENWRDELRRIDRGLGLGLEWTDDVIAAGDEFISAELNHRGELPPIEDSASLGLARSLHRSLLDTVPANDPAWIFEAASAEIDRLVFRQLETGAWPASPERAAMPPDAGASTGETPPAARPAAAAVLLNPRRLADQQRRETALRRIADGDVVGGADLLIELAQADTELPEVYHDLGIMAREQSDLAAAKELFAVAIAKSPKPSRSSLELARLEMRDGLFEPALATLSPYLRKNPDDADALALVREILGAGGELSAIAWARLIADLKTSSSGPAENS